MQPSVQYYSCYMAWKTKVHTWCRYCHFCINAPMWREKRWLQGIFDPPSYIISFLVKNRDFWVTKYFVNHYKLSSILTKYSSINLLDSFSAKSCSNTSNKTVFNQINYILCLYYSLQITISRDKNDVKKWHFSKKKLTSNHYQIWQEGSTGLIYPSFCEKIS